MAFVRSARFSCAAGAPPVGVPPPPVFLAVPPVLPPLVPGGGVPGIVSSSSVDVDDLDVLLLFGECEKVLESDLYNVEMSDSDLDVVSVLEVGVLVRGLLDGDVSGVVVSLVDDDVSSITVTDDELTKLVSVSESEVELSSGSGRAAASSSCCWGPLGKDLDLVNGGGSDGGGLLLRAFFAGCSRVSSASLTVPLDFSPFGFSPFLIFFGVSSLGGIDYLLSDNRPHGCGVRQY